MPPPLPVVTGEPVSIMPGRITYQSNGLVPFYDHLRSRMKLPPLPRGLRQVNQGYADKRDWPQDSKEVWQVDAIPLEYVDNPPPRLMRLGQFGPEMIETAGPG